MKRFLISIYFVSILFSIPQLDANAITEHFWNNKGKYFIGAASLAGLYLVSGNNSRKPARISGRGKGSREPQDASGNNVAFEAEDDSDQVIVKIGTLETRPTTTLDPQGGYWFVFGREYYEIRNYRKIDLIRETKENEKVKVILTNIYKSNRQIITIADMEILHFIPANKYEKGKTYEVTGKVKRGDGFMKSRYFFEVNNRLEFWLSNYYEYKLQLEENQEVRLSIEMIGDYDSESRIPTMKIKSLTTKRLVP